VAARRPGRRAAPKLEWSIVLIIPLHGATGAWDEIACLALPATVIMAIALSLLRQERGQPGEADEVVPARRTDDPVTVHRAPGRADGEVSGR